MIDLPPNLEGYPEHDHAESGREEVFVVLRGSGDGLRVLALGGVPGQPYKAPDVTKLGEPDPMAR